MSPIQTSRNLFRRACRVTAVAAGLLAAAILAPGEARAQFDGAGLAELTRHDYLHRDIVLFSQGLKLDEYQRLILDSLFEDYRDRFDAGWQATQVRIQDLVHEIPDLDRNRILTTVMAPFDEWRQEKDRLKSRFEDDVRAILNPEQARRWPAFQQQMTREKTMHLGRLSGESLNLFPLVRDLRLDERRQEQVEPVMEQYSTELHEALKQRNQILQNDQASFIRHMRVHGEPADRGNIQPEIQARMRVRDINFRYVDVIAQALPEDVRDSFRDRALETANPRVFRTLPAMRMLTRAVTLDDLDEDTRAAIVDLKEIFSAELEQMNRRLHDGMLDFEPRQLRNHAELFAARQTGANVPRLEDPTRPAFAEREERAQFYVDQLRGLLSPEQLASLPGFERYRAGDRAVARERRSIGREGGAVAPRGGARDPQRTPAPSGRDGGRDPAGGRGR